MQKVLRFFIPGKLDIGKGFVINSNNEVSTECDIVIFDAQASPMIESNELQRFFPVETVAAIGEVKSDLSLRELEKALVKLSKNKSIRDFVGDETPSHIYRYQDDAQYCPKTIPFDQVSTFLICNKFDFNLSRDKTDNFVSVIRDIYSRNNIERSHMHNLILSIEDGLIYYNASDADSPYPIIPGHDLKIKWMTNDSNTHIHFKTFCSFMYQLTSYASIMWPNLDSYINKPDQNQWFKEK